MHRWPTGGDPRAEGEPPVRCATSGPGACPAPARGPAPPGTRPELGLHPRAGEAEGAARELRTGLGLPLASRLLLSQARESARSLCNLTCPVTPAGGAGGARTVARVSGPNTRLEDGETETWGIFVLLFFWMKFPSGFQFKHTL